MSAVSPCVPCCPTPQVTNVPGVEGPAASNGTNGISAFTVVTGGGFFTPALVGGTATIPVANNQWCVVGEYIIVSAGTPANFLVTGLTGTTSITAVYLNLPGDVGTGLMMPGGATVAPVGQRGADSLFVTTTAVNLTLSPTIHDVVLVTADGKTITLPTAVGISGKVYTIKQTASFSSGTTVATTSSQTIDGNTTRTIGAQYSAITVISDGANWQILVKLGTIT